MLVDAERAASPISDVIDDDDDVAIAAITAAELLVGVELAGPLHRSNRHSYVEALLAALPIEDYDLEVARAHALLLAHAGRSGRQPGAHDLIIAATAVARSRIVVTSDARGFADLPGIALRVV